MTWDTNSNRRVTWITGLSGAGKSTIARATAEQLREIGTTPVLIDGDEIREAIRCPHTGHDPVSRLANAYRISRLAKLMAEQGHTVIVATMSLFHEIHAWNRKHLPNYFEVWIEVDLPTLQKRDLQGLYSQAVNGVTHNVAGIDLTYERPENPDLILHNKSTCSNLEEMANEIIKQTQASENYYEN
jgi:adenylylsulfate kinase-like enzyme